MKPLTEIKKSCGERVGKSKGDNIICGKKYWLNGQWAFSLCPTCQALHEQAQEFEKMINDWYIKTREKKTYVDLSDVQELLKEVQGDKGK